MQFEWDDTKNKINQSKHGISFETAALIFDDPYVISFLDGRYEELEERWHSLGRAINIIIYVAYIVLEDEDGEEIIRIISARESTSREERRYYFDR